MQRALKPIRVALALLFLGGLTFAFADFRDAVPSRWAHWLATVQFTPALVGTLTGSVTALLVLAALVLVTLVGGRIYCSAICPLGILQDVVRRLTLRWRAHPLRYSPANDRLRYGILQAVIAIALFGAGGIVSAWVDPYSHFGRIIVALVRPVVVVANNAASPLAPELGAVTLYRVPVPWAGIALSAIALGVGALLVALVAWRGRIFCNTLCPVGAVLGLLARIGVFRLVLARDACTKCARCLHACKAQCIDLRTGTIDASRCVACFNCVGACEQGGISYRLAWSAPAPTASVRPADAQRRALVAGALLVGPAVMLRAAEPPVAAPVAPAPTDPVAPPGAGSVARLLERCTACQLCVSACPTQVLQPALFHYGWSGFAKPRLDFNRAFCNFECHQCGEVCPTGAIASLPLARKKLTSVGVAKLERSLCIVEAAGTDCAACSEHCPTKAVDTVPFRENLRLPQVHEELCIGCGACEFACPVRPQRAINVAARRDHVPAREAKEAKPEFRRPAADFPF